MTHTDSSPPRGRFVPRKDAARPADPQSDDGGDIDPEIEQQIDENLRRLYSQRLEQELPDDLMALVAQLRSGQDPQ